MAYAGTQNNEGACIFVINGNQVAVPTVESHDNKSFLTDWEPLTISDPQQLQCIEAQATFYIETTAAEINKLIGQQISEI